MEDTINIFAIEGTNNQIDWVQSAKSLDNYRVVKMILESCQMLCTAINDQHGEKVTPYKNAHFNHPSTKWVRASSANFECLVEHTLAMLEEYKSDNIVESYRNFYSDKPRMRYPEAKVPQWFIMKRTEPFQLLIDENNPKKFNRNA